MQGDNEQSLFKSQSEYLFSNYYDRNVFHNQLFLNVIDQDHEIVQEPDLEPQGQREDEPEKKKKIKKEKRSRDQVSLNAQLQRKKKKLQKIKDGRPENNQDQRQHLIISKSYNDIVYHFCRFLIFLKLVQQDDTSMHSLTLSKIENQWMTSAKKIMSIDNFPDYTSSETQYFLLHSNSIHFLLNHRKNSCKDKKITISSQELKYIMFAFLQKRTMLTTSVFDYIIYLWEDIIYIVNHPDEQEIIVAEPKDLNIDKIENNFNHYESNSPAEMQKPKPNQIIHQQKKMKQTKIERRQSPSQLNIMKGELRQDRTIAAYEIACYFHACCVKFDIEILPANAFEEAF